jgi:NADH-quinone oxidoreductase subunit L
MTRVMLMTFFGERRWGASASAAPGQTASASAAPGQTASASAATGQTEAAHPHESPAVMTWPMILLAIGSVASGGFLAIGGTLAHWLEPVVGAHEAERGTPAWVVTIVVLAVVAAGIAIAYRMYGTRPVPAEAPAGSAVTVAARQDLYGDVFNERVFMRPGQLLTKGLVEIDDDAVDGAANGLAALVGRVSDGFRQLQTGFARSYALSMLAGAALVVAAILAVRLW